MNEWHCLECGYHGGEFILKGNGFVQCPKCDVLYLVGQHSELFPLPTDKGYNLYKKNEKSQGIGEDDRVSATI